MGFHELCRPLAGDACRTLRKSLAEGALTFPVRQRGLHFGIGGPEVFPLGHHQRPRLPRSFCSACA